MSPRSTVRFRCKYALGDIVVLTAAVRDLHRAYPNVFRTSVETSAPDVWAHNPHVVPATYFDTVIDCNGITLDRSGATGRHYVHAFLDLINRRLGTMAQISEIKGDIHLSEEEKSWHSDIWSLCQREIPFWIVCPGGKHDIPLKWWDHQRYQRVVDALRGRIQFVQVGSWGNHHPPLAGAIDLRGQTTVRDLIHLVHYAKGVLCGVTSLMHLAAAVPTEDGNERAAVIIGGAREPASWEAYPGHEFISTQRAVSCGCCWKSSVTGPVPGRCSRPRGELSECMDLITPEDVLDRFEYLARSGRITYLPSRDAKFSRKAVQDSKDRNDFDQHNITPSNAPARAAAFIAQIPPYRTHRFQGRGIVICAGGPRYFHCAWICIRMLRRSGCTLPIELWHLGRHEIDRAMEELVEPFGVRCVNARAVMDRHPMRNPLGWELKSYALMHSAFAEVLLLDADNVAVRDPTFLFDSPEYQSTGAVFWPDYGCLAPQRRIWKLCGVNYRREPEFESGQMVINKRICWRALNLAWWYNDHSEFFYRHIYGDKETFHMAWRRLDQPYAMVPFPIRPLEGTMCQHDFAGRLLFQHRNMPKWVFSGVNERLSGFVFEEECLAYLDELKSVWSGKINGRDSLITKNGLRFRAFSVDETVFRCVALENEYRLPRRFHSDDLILDVGAHIGSFALACFHRGSRQIFAFEPHPDNFALARQNLREASGVRLRRAAVLDRAGRVELSAFPGIAGLLNSGGARARPSARGPSPAVSFGALLRRFQSVALLKLDCEGSEWPILLHGGSLANVSAVCGEYHLFPEIASQFGLTKTLDPALLFETLTSEFPHALVEEPNRDRVGRFWASRRERYFSHGTNARVFQKKGNCGVARGFAGLHRGS